MSRLDRERVNAGLPPLPFGVVLIIVRWSMATSVRRIIWTSPRLGLPYVASRIEGLCRELERRVLISEAVATLCAPSLPSAGSYSLRDSANPMAFYNLPETFLL
jgi:adenylate cyclase